MNKRLLLALYDRSGLGAYMPVDYKGQELEVEEHMEKFAELIVRECAEQSMSIGRYNTPSGITPDLAIAIAVGLKKHFGVEE
jgi:hypothetical protein